MTDYASLVARLDALVARLRDYSPENRQHVVHEAADAIEALRASHEQWDKESLCALIAERDALRAERDELKRCLDGGFDCAAQRIALRADAMRYRWLRDFDRTQQRIPWLVRQGLYPNETIWWSFGLDNAIDAAMAAPPVAGPTEPAT